MAEKAGKKQAAKKSARKSAQAAKKKSPPAKGKAAGKRKLVEKKGGAKKSARKAADKAATKIAAKAAPKKPSAKTAGRKKAAKAAQLAARARKALATASGARKTARSRLGQRAAPAPLQALRKTALRTALLPGGASKKGAAKLRPAAAARDFDPAQALFREARQQDWPAIGRLLTEAFGRLDESETIERLRAARDMAGEFVAEYAGLPVAHVAFCTLGATIDAQPFLAAGLLPLAVAGECEGKGVATRLLLHALAAMRGLGHAAIFVAANPGFHARFGFSAGVAARFNAPFAGYCFQALEFEPGALRGARGETNWPACLDGV